VVHRLDKDTSGVMVFAKNIEAQRHLSHQFQNNTVNKEYVALVIGRPAEQEGMVDAPIEPDKQHVGAMKVDKRGKPARTAWRIEETFRGLTLVRAMPKTGKTHQIRVHLQHLGHPLAVDPLYGPSADEKGPGIFLSKFKRGYRLGKFAEERPLISRLTLHAEKLRLTLPNGSELEIVAEMPKDLRATINMLRKHGRG
jgi:23S rRNA pseudouridine955/2504/2580 synthase/23S rRNA pseudouridine1911/1915/1917 synthase